MILLNLALIFVFQFVVLGFHEFGHASIARLFRFRLFSVRLGYSRELFKFKIVGIPLTICALPFIGLTYAVPASQSWVRTRMWFYVLGGPGVQILIIVAIYLLRPDAVQPAKAIPSLFSQIQPTVAFATSNLMVLLISLYPRETRRPNGNFRTDGYNLLTIPFKKLAEFRDLEKAVRRLEAYHLLEGGKADEALVLYEELLKESPDDDVLRHDIAVANLTDGRYEEALHIFESLLSSSDFQKTQLQIVLKNNIAWVIAVLGRAELLERAEQFSREAHAFSPNLTVFSGTRGAVLIRLGRVNEGIDFLKWAYRRQSVPVNRAAEACFIALGEFKRGKRVDSKNWMERARQESPNYHLIALLEEELIESTTL